MLFYRNTHEFLPDGTGEPKPWPKTLSPEQEAIWQSQIHAGGFVGHMLDSMKGTTFLKLMDNVCSYEDLYHADKSHTTDEILAALFELVRVGLVRYEIIP
jgi:predicted nucleic-acid-binding Zn-ribbon protein